MRLYKSYMFRTKDPVIDVLRTMVQDSGEKLGKIEAGSGVKAATMRNWFVGETRRPQFCSVAAVASALGHREIPIGGHRTKGRPKKRLNGHSKGKRR